MNRTWGLFRRGSPRTLLIAFSLLIAAGCQGDVPSAGSISMSEDVIKKAEEARKTAATKKKTGSTKRQTAPRS